VAFVGVVDHVEALFFAGAGEAEVFIGALEGEEAGGAAAVVLAEELVAGRDRFAAEGGGWLRPVASKRCGRW
jgi:hypothetical protein